MDPTDPLVAQKIVTEYVTLLEKHAREDVYPAPLASLPYAKEILKASIRTSAAALTSSGQMTDDMRAFLEVAYMSLADYVEDDLVQLMREYQKAGAELAADARLAKEKMSTPAWQQLSTTSRLAGDIAKTLAQETESLRCEFQQFLTGIAESDHE